MKSLVDFITEKKFNLSKHDVQALCDVWAIFMKDEEDPTWDKIFDKVKKEKNVSEKDRWASEVYSILKDNLKTSRELTLDDFEPGDFNMFKTIMKYVNRKYNKDIEDWNFFQAVKSL